MSKMLFQPVANVKIYEIFLRSFFFLFSFLYMPLKSCMSFTLTAHLKLDWLFQGLKSRGYQRLQH